MALSVQVLMLLLYCVNVRLFSLISDVLALGNIPLYLFHILCIYYIYIYLLFLQKFTLIYIYSVYEKGAALFFTITLAIFGGFLIFSPMETRMNTPQ